MIGANIFTGKDCRSSHYPPHRSLFFHLKSFYVNNIMCSKFTPVALQLMKITAKYENIIYPIIRD